MYKEIDWVNLSEWRKYQKFITMFKMHNGLSPDCLKKLPGQIIDNIPSNLRNQDDYVVRNMRTRIHSNSFLPTALTLWNNLDVSVRTTQTLNEFKSILRNSMFQTYKIPVFYVTGTRKFSMIHSRLKNRYSNLNFHRFTRHLILDSSCNCGNGNETLNIIS